LAGIEFYFSNLNAKFIQMPLKLERADPYVNVAGIFEVLAKDKYMDRFLTMKQVEETTGYKRSRIYEFIAAKTFPKPEKPNGPRGRSVWWESNAEAWKHGKRDWGKPPIKEGMIASSSRHNRPLGAPLRLVRPVADIPRIDLEAVVRAAMPAARALCRS
jgi:predicted DNA-binding transcriptional regulator AlpA